MQKVIALIVIIALAVVSAHDCNANLSGGNNASPARWIRSSSCNANLSGGNNASPARTVVCSGKGGCVNGACVCNTGFQGENCEFDCTTSAAPSTTGAPSTSAPTVQLTQQPTTTSAPTTCAPCPCGEANLSGDNNASPARRFRRAADSCPACAVCPTVAPTTTVAPSTTVAPTTTVAPSTTVAQTTTYPPVELTPRPSTSAPTTSSAPQTSQAPSVGLPICGAPEANLSGDNNASPARNSRSSSCNVNLSGDNNASPAKRFRNMFSEPVCSGKGGCVNGACVCNVGFRGENCEEQYCVVASSTDAPSTSAPATTAAPSVNLTVRPTMTSSPSSTRAPTQNESGEDNSRETNSAAKVTALFGVVVATLAALML